jgi:hypothetical protein
VTAQLRSGRTRSAAKCPAAIPSRPPGRTPESSVSSRLKKTHYGFFDIELASGLILRCCTLHEKNGRRWVGLPAKPYTANDGGQTWAAIVDFRDKQASSRFQELITPLAVEAWQKAEVAA